VSVCLPATSLETITLAVASQLEAELAPVYGELQVAGRRIFNPTPPTLDVYPGDPFQEQTAYGHASREVFFTIRARVSMADNEAGQSTLLQLLNADGPGSVIAALAADRDLQGWVQDSLVDGVSGFAIHQDVSEATPLLGCTWRLRIVL